jgi:hypothetical protein
MHLRLREPAERLVIIADFRETRTDMLTVELTGAADASPTTAHNISSRLGGSNQNPVAVGAAVAEPTPLAWRSGRRAPYAPATVWYKMKNRAYTQMEGRGELFHPSRP